MRKLKLLLMAFALLVGGGNSSWAYQTPVADGIYYLYNTGCTSGETGFMSTGNAYGFQVVIDNFGFPIKLIDAGNGKFQFQFIHHEGFLSDDGFMYSDGGNTGDNPRARTITLQHQGDGIYKLINTSNNKEIEQWYDHNVVGDGEGNRRNYLWQFLSKAERDAMVAGYATSVKLAAATSMGMPASVDTESEFDDYLSTNYIALDQSSKITNGTFDTNHNTTDWSTTANDNRTFNIGWGNEATKNTPEVYEGAGYLTHTTISVDKVGLYKVSVNALYRCGNNENNNRIGALGYDGSVAYLQVNNNIAKVSDWYSGKINGNGPSGPTDANNNYFSQGKYLTEVYVYVGDAKTIDISLHSHAMTWGGWLIFNNFKLTYYSDEVSEEEATAILATATTLLEQEMDATLKSNLTSEKTTFDGARTVANYNALQTAIDDAQASAEAYALFAPERTKALALGMTSEAIAALAPDVNALKVAEYTFVSTNYSYGVSLGEWTKVNATDRTGQHWDGSTGDKASPYSEQADGWEGGNWKCSYSQELALPVGNYVFKVAGRKSSDDANLTLEVKNGETLLGSVNDFPNGDTGLGINTSGVTDFTTGEGHNYAFGGAGRGWEWRYVKFTLAEPATVTVKVAASATPVHQWVGFCNATVQTDNEANISLIAYNIALGSAQTIIADDTYENVTGSEKTELQAAIAADGTLDKSDKDAIDAAKLNLETKTSAFTSAKATYDTWATSTITKNTTNVGTGVFQLNETTNNSLYSAYETARNHEITSSTVASDVAEWNTAVATAINNYKNQPLNAPAADKHYNIIVATAGHTKNGNAIVMGREATYPVYQGDYISNNTGFTLNASAEPNANLAQACVFTAVEGKANTYYISMERTEGTVYLTYGSLNDSKVNWKADQIQATTDADKKGEFRIAATTTSGVFNIVNTNNDKLIGCQDGGNIYSTENNGDFSIAEASQASVGITIASDVKYATRIFPFAPTLPEGVKAYSCAGESSGTLTLDEVATPAANTPYILYAENGYPATGEAALAGWGTAANLNVKTEGWLTGVYEGTTAPNDCYVLAKIGDEVAVYQVDNDSKPTVGAYRCYLTVPSGGSARALYFPESEATAIDAISALTSGEAQIFNAAGAQLPSLQKGMNILQLSNGKSTKVMVK